MDGSAANTPTDGIEAPTGVGSAFVSAWAWVMIFTTAAVGALVQIPLALLTWPFDRSRRIAGGWVRLLAVFAVRLHPTWRFAVHGPAPRALPKRTVVVSNHVSNSDVFLIYQLPWEMKWMSKRSLFFVPFIGWLAFFAGFIPVVRGDKASARRALDRSARYLDRGVPVFIFPEGTRSETGEMLPFKDGAFRLAIRSGAEVLPVAVAGTRPALPKHSWRFGHARALVTVGEPIPTRGMTLDDLERLKTETRAAIAALRDRIAPLAG
jgi:1-acyl-sn-glycerol-3-phosphate acyltransferase